MFQILIEMVILQDNTCADTSYRVYYFPIVHNKETVSTADNTGEIYSFYLKAV